MVEQPESASSISQVFMMSTPINVANRSKDYQILASVVGKEKEVAPSSSTPSSGPLHIERSNLDSVCVHPLEVC